MPNPEIRPLNGGTNELGNYSFYCRMCGWVVKRDRFPENPCEWCGNILVDDGWGISGDTNEGGGSEVGVWKGSGGKVELFIDEGRTRE